MKVIFNKTTLNFAKAISETKVYETMKIDSVQYTLDGSYNIPASISPAGAVSNKKVITFVLNNFNPSRQYYIETQYSSNYATSEESRKTGLKMSIQTTDTSKGSIGLGYCDKNILYSATFDNLEENDSNTAKIDISVIYTSKEELAEDVNIIFEKFKMYHYEAQED